MNTEGQNCEEHGKKWERKRAGGERALSLFIYLFIFVVGYVTNFGVIFFGVNFVKVKD